MFIFWITVLATFSSYIFIGKRLQQRVSISFLYAILMGKLLMRYPYARLSDLLAAKVSNLKGASVIALVIAGMVQSVKLIFE